MIRVYVFAFQNVNWNFSIRMDFNWKTQSIFFVRSCFPLLFVWRVENTIMKEEKNWNEIIQLMKRQRKWFVEINSGRWMKWIRRWHSHSHSRGPISAKMFTEPCLFSTNGEWNSSKMSKYFSFFLLLYKYRKNVQICKKNVNFFLLK